MASEGFVYSTDASLIDSEGYLNSSVLDDATLTRWNGSIRPIPFPEYMTPKGGIPLQETPVDVLLNVSPHVIAHLQRTASMGGFQVVSPRQTPFCKTMIRHAGGERRLGDHVVGSVADPLEVWPTIDDDDLSRLLPDEPLPTLGEELQMEPKTDTIPLTKAGKLLSDPILSCLIKGRAVVDMLRRDDINGDADGVLRLLAEAWGVPIEMLSELEAYTLGIEGPLKRHAIKIDEVYAMMYAPIHVKRCISVCAVDVTTDLLPLDTSLDWKRMRVFCEAVFALAANIEGYPLTGLRCFPKPGDQGARTDRPHVFAFLPAPASAWLHSPETFSICPVHIDGKRRVRALPREVLDALSKYVTMVRPISHALEGGHRYATRRVTTHQANSPTAETISECYRIMVDSVYTGGTRGRTAAAAIRHLIYNTLESLPDGERLRIARYMKIAREMCKVHLGVDTVPDSVINKLAIRYNILGLKIRSAVVAEAARRGSTVEEWWHNVLAQSPAAYEHFHEGSNGWARVGLWLAFKGPTERWDALIKAINISALSRASAINVHGIALPGRKGSIERILEAARHVVKQVTATFASYYAGVADVGMAVADEAERMGKGRTAAILREGCYLWILRARCFRGTNVNVIAHGQHDKSPHHFRIRAQPADLVIVPAPYRAFEAYLTHVEGSELISREVKMSLKEKRGPVVSQYFAALHRSIIACQHSTITKYLLNPQALASDIEASWTMLIEDIRHVVKVYSAEAEEVPVPPQKKPTPSAFTPTDFKMPEMVGMDYFAALGTMEPDNVDWVEDVLDRMPPDVQDDVYSAKFAGPSDLMSRISDLEREYAVSADGTADTVR